MKMLALPLALTLAAGLAMAQEPTTNDVSNKPSSISKKPGPVSHAQPGRMKAEVVSANFNAKSITLKTENGEKTMNVKGRAVRRLKSLKAGEEVWITSRDYPGGEAVVSIKLAKTHMASRGKASPHHAAVKY
jgi:hypothetical protein